MNATLALLALLLFAPPLPSGKPMAAPQLFPLDPVALVDTGNRVEGDAAHEVTHGGVRYRFATAAAQEAFAATPAKYMLASSGGCARMGPLSGTCSFEWSEVVDGKLYVFASDACRATFLKSPREFLEPRDDAFAENEEGRALAEKVLGWMHAEKLPRGGVVLLSQRRETANGADAIVRKEHRINLALGFSELSAWGESAWWTQASFAGAQDEGCKLSTVSEGATLDALQLHALRRVAMLEPIFLASVLNQHRGAVRAGERETWSIGEDSIEGQVLATHWSGVTVEWLVDATSGELLAQRALQRLENARIARETTLFSAWSDINGALVPLARQGATHQLRFDSIEALDPVETATVPAQ